MSDRQKSRLCHKFQLVYERVKPVFELAKQALLRPTLKQMEAMGRFLHTLSSASFIGLVTLIVASHWSSWTALQAFLLLTAGVLLFCIGTILSKGE